MAIYSIWVLHESSISFDDNTVLDGVTQGDGSHLVDATMTINSTQATELSVNDAGSETNFSDNDNGQRLNGDQTVDGVLYADNTRVEAEYTFYLLDESTGIEYTVISVNINNSSPSYATVEGLAFVDQAPPIGAPLKIIGADEGPTNGGPQAIDVSQIVPLCFAAGTLIETVTGMQAVETLRAGDLIVQADGAPLPLRRAFKRSISRSDLDENPKLLPVKINAGALGHGLPHRDLRVSRQHRMLVSSKISERMFGVPEVLVPAIKLVDLPGIAEDTDTQEVDYFHLLFDNHQVVFAEGAPTESLYTGKTALSAISPEARLEVLLMYPKLHNPSYVPPSARLFPERKQQKKLIARHLKNQKSLLDGYETTDRQMLLTG